MIVSLDPNFQTPEVRNASPYDLTEWSSHILHSKYRQYYWQGKGILSIKTFFGGLARYRAGQGHFSVGDSNYLILNHDQPYSIEIDSKTEVESFCVFFDRQLTEDVFRSISLATGILLDTPTLADHRSINFFERTYQYDARLLLLLQRLRKIISGNQFEAYQLEEMLHNLLSRLVGVHNKTVLETKNLNALRAATREELYRRNYRARDYMLAEFAESLTLNDIARVACLSPNHLLRTFKQIFGQTPHQFLTGIRLDRAEILLRSTNLSVTEICLAVGFESVSSFSSLFSRRYEAPPVSFRQSKR